MGPRLDLCPGAPVLRGPGTRTDGTGGHRRRSRAGQGGGLDHHRPHLAGGGDQARLTRGEVPRRTRGGATRLQQLRSRRGNHEVMMRGTFANVRLRNELAPGTEGPWTTHLPSGEVMAVFDAALRYREESVPLLVIAGKEYGSGSSRDWAAKGPALLGIRAVLAESFERIHRSNLVGMGVLPLQFAEGQSAASLGLTGQETFTIGGLAGGSGPRQGVRASVRREDGS